MRVVALRCLTVLRARESLPAVLELLENEKPPAPTGACVWRYGPIEAAQGFIRRLDFGAVEARILAEWLPTQRDGATSIVIMEKLGQMGPEAKEAIPALVRKLDDSSPGVRLAALQALVRLRASEALPVVLERLRGGVQDFRDLTLAFRSEVARVIVSEFDLSPPEAGILAGELGREPIGWIESMMIDELFKMGPKAKQVFPALYQLLRKTPEMRAADVERVLRAIENDASVSDATVREGSSDTQAGPHPRD